MKLISSKLGIVIVVLCAISILIGSVTVFKPDVSEFFNKSVNKEVDVAENVLPNKKINLSDFSTTNYTSAQINADPHLYGIGSTKAEYVTVKFNETYTEAIITANTEDSDGLIKDDASVYTKTFKNHKNTIEKIIFKTGVTNLPTWTLNDIYTSGCSDLPNLKYLELSKTMTAISNNVLEYCRTVETIIIPEGVVSIGANAFAGCSSLKKITLPKSLTYLGEYAFMSCTSLKSVVCNSVNLVAAGSRTCPSFAYCSSLTNISFGNFVTRIPSFICRGVTSISSVSTNNATIIGQSAFESTNISDFDFSNISKIENYSFAGTKLTNLIIPSNVKKIGDYAFYNCSSLKSIELENGVETIGQYGFYNCWYLNYVKVPSSVSAIGDYAIGFVQNGSICHAEGYGHFKGIKGTAGSYAQTWANSNNVTFVEI